jgi:hypothetical protein
MKTPVAFMIFNRPDTTKRVFEAIRQAQPSKLLIIADGARPDRPGEAEKCQQVRDIIDVVDWDCEVLKNYADTNLGCQQRLLTGLNWVFSEVEEAIILEDDCLPDPTFFPFCQEILERYRDDMRVMSISGNNFQFGKKRTDHSYYFSRYFHCWGWATWRRAWQYNDPEIKLLPTIKSGDWLKDILGSDRAVKYWQGILDRIHESKTWDYQWMFAHWIQSGLSIIPNENLVSNIGFGADATHTNVLNHPLANMTVNALKFPLNHPPFLIRNVNADMSTEYKFYSVGIIDKVKNKIHKNFALSFKPTA